MSAWDIFYTGLGVLLVAYGIILYVCVRNAEPSDEDDV